MDLTKSNLKTSKLTGKTLPRNCAKTQGKYLRVQIIIKHIERENLKETFLGKTLPKTLGKKTLQGKNLGIKSFHIKTWNINLREKSLQEYFKQTSREKFYRKL